MESDFLHERRIGLQQFIDAVLRNSLFCHHMAVKKFLDPENYTEELETTRQQQAAMFVLSEPSWQLQENLKDIGWRIRKHYYGVRLEKEDESFFFATKFPNLEIFFCNILSRIFINR